MPINLPIVLNPPDFAPGYCPASWPEFANALAAGMTGYLQGQYNTFNYGNTAPEPDDRVKPWLRLNSDGTMDRWYVYASGAWMCPHELEAGSDFLQMWTGDPADIATLDGANFTGGPATGPFWEIYSAMEGKSPMGVAPVVPGTATPFPVGTDYGEGQHTLTLAEMPKHSHTMKANPTADINGGGRTINGEGDPAFSAFTNTSEQGADTAHNNIHPVRAVYFLKRTSRIFRVAP